MQENVSNKQFISVLIFLMVIIVSISILAVSSCEDKKVNKTSNKTDNNVNEEVDGSESVEVIVSNSNSNQDSYITSNEVINSNSNSTSNKPSGTTSNNPSSSNKNDKYIPVSYFSAILKNNKIYVGGTTSVTVKITPSNATEKEVIYRSSNESVAVISDKGVITGKGIGSAVITVYVKNVGSTTMTINVVEKPTTDIPVKGVSISPNSLSMSKGGKASLKAIFNPSDATNKKVTWSSSNESIATVSSNGVVTAKSVGTTTITVKTNDGGYKATTKVTVKSDTIPVTGISVTPSNLTMIKGKSSTLTATVSPSNATNKSVLWTSSNESIATVDSNGKVTAKGVGTTTIVAKTSDGGYKGVVNITVKSDVIPVTGVTISPKNIFMKKGATVLVSSTITPSNATNKKVTYKSSNTSVAIVDSSGIVKGVGVGSATITVTTASGGKTDTAKVTVTNNSIDVTGVSLNKTSLTLDQGATSTLTATVTPSNATNKAVTWSSSNSSIATVDSNGKITAKKGGTAIITVTTSDGGYKANCSVTVKAKHGWYTINGNRYYYENGVMLTNTYVDYIYLNSQGIAQPKIGSFTATLYGARAWANQSLNIRQSASKSSTLLGNVPEGGKMTILSDVSNGYLKIRYNGVEGYVFANYIFINLPDVMPDVYYEISNANASIFKTAGYNISNVTGKNLYGFTKMYNEKIDKTTYYAPLLYPVAVKFQKAYNSAKAEGYSFKVYDSYRPQPVEKLVTANYKALYDSNATVRNKVDYDKEGNSWGYGWFMTKTGTSRHCQAIALDLTLTDSKGNNLTMQSTIHTLDTSSLRKYNNANANKLSSFMTSAGFSTLASEWWHYEDNTYKGNQYETFYIK